MGEKLKADPASLGVGVERSWRMGRGNRED
jgi:hypothetical protein